jgi:hypothetical protein
MEEGRALIKPALASKNLALAHSMVPFLLAVLVNF